MGIVCPNVLNLDEKEILNYVTDSGLTPTKENRLKVIKAIYKILGYNLEKDLLLFLLDESDKQLVLAPAGGGKTTAIEVKTLLFKLFRKSKRESGGNVKGQNMLALVYNAANVDDIKDKHRELVYRLKASGLSEVQAVKNMDANLQVYTFHGFCKSWIDTYPAKAGLANFKFMNDDSKKSLMKASVKVNLKKCNLDISEDDVDINSLLNLYNFQRESLLEYEDLEGYSQFEDVRLPLDLVENIFNAYDRVKAKKKCYDYTDLLTKFLKLIEDESVLERIEDCYEFITADETQDTTAIISKILQRLSRKTPIICIGDDDQMIYNFRGASSTLLLNFEKLFDGGKIFLLRTNRRCPSNVVELAKELLKLNKNRYPKDIKSIKPEGLVEFRGFSDYKGEVYSIINSLKDMTEDELRNTCICYRNKSSSRLLSTQLFKNGIPFHVMSGIKPFDYGLWVVTIQVLQALAFPTNKRLLSNLYKALPITKAEFADALKWDYEKDEPSDNNALLFLGDINFPTKINNRRFNEELQFLIQVSENINKNPMNSYFPVIFNLILKHYWNYQIQIRGLDSEEDMGFRHDIIDYFNVPYLFIQMKTKYENDKNTIKYDNMNKCGVALTTFHSQKGMEWDNVFIMDLEESIFPNFLGIESKNYSDSVKQELKECETRLMYVAVTRTKKKLYMYYSKEDPSYYAQVMIDYYSSVNRNNSSSDKLKGDENKPSLQLLENAKEVAESPSVVKVKASAKDTILGRFFA